MSVRYCDNCGAGWAADYNFCPRDGMALVLATGGSEPRLPESTPTPRAAPARFAAPATSAPRVERNPWAAREAATLPVRHASEPAPLRRAPEPAPMRRDPTSPSVLGAAARFELLEASRAENGARPAWVPTLARAPEGLPPRAAAEFASPLVPPPASRADEQRARVSHVPRSPHGPHGPQIQGPEARGGRSSSRPAPSSAEVLRAVRALSPEGRSAIVPEAYELAHPAQAESERRPAPVASATARFRQPLRTSPRDLESRRVNSPTPT